MQRHLYFICPSDYVEQSIHKSFRGVKYFYASLGNSIEFNANTTNQIKQIITKNKINRISFVLADNNPIILDAFGHQSYSHITSLKSFYNDINDRNKNYNILRDINNYQLSVFTSYLDYKVESLKLVLNNSLSRPIHIDGKIYFKNDKTFHNIDKDPRLIWTEPFSMN